MSKVIGNGCLECGGHLAAENAFYRNDCRAIIRVILIFVIGKKTQYHRQYNLLPPFFQVSTSHSSVARFRLPPSHRGRGARYEHVSGLKSSVDRGHARGHGNGTHYAPTTSLAAISLRIKATPLASTPSCRAFLRL